MLLSSLRFLLLFLFMFSYSHAESDETAFDLYSKSEYQKAIPLLLKLANDGNLRAQAALGDAYLYGKGVDKSSDNAFMWLNQCMNKGESRCEFNAATAFIYEEIGPDVNYKKAFDLLNRVLEINQNHSRSRILLGVMYENGLGVDKNTKKSFEIYSKLASEDYLDAIFKLGDSYFYGIGVTKDLTKAFNAYKTSAELGHIEGQYKLGHSYFYGNGVDKDVLKSKEWFDKAADQGFPEAQNFLCKFYLNGVAVKKDLEVAFDLCKKSADNNNYFAIATIAEMYLKGLGVKPNVELALQYYKKSVDQDNYESAYELAMIYYLGEIVEKNIEEAVNLFNIVINSKNIDKYNSKYIDSLLKLGFIFSNQDVYKKNREKALGYFKLAADSGSEQAMTNIGILYKLGLGVQQDYTESMKWFEMAIDRNSTQAKYLLAQNYEYGWGVEKNFQKVLKLLKGLDYLDSDDRYNRISRESACLEEASTKLFDTYLKCADRNNMMAAIKEAGVKVKVEDKNKWSDIYFTSNILKGTSELTVSYTVDDYFSKAEYIFPAKQMDLLLVSNVKDMIASKYGEPSQSIGKPNLGKVTYKWKLQDGINIEVFRGWPNTTTYLAFIYPENNKAMLAEMERQRKAREAKKYNSQDNAF